MPIRACEGRARQFVHRQGRRNVEQDHRAHAIWIVHREAVRHTRAAIMCDHKEPMVAERLHQRHEVDGHDALAVGHVIGGGCGDAPGAPSLRARVDVRRTADAPSCSRTLRSTVLQPLTQGEVYLGSLTTGMTDVLAVDLKDAIIAADFGDVISGHAGAPDEDLESEQQESA